MLRLIGMCHHTQLKKLPSREKGCLLLAFMLFMPMNNTGNKKEISKAQFRKAF
jgi:hypothetical protein